MCKYVDVKMPGQLINWLMNQLSDDSLYAIDWY
jgi:hypothetical protein